MKICSSINSPDSAANPKHAVSNKGTLIKEHNPIPVTQVQEQLIQEIEEKTIAEKQLSKKKKDK